MKQAVNYRKKRVECAIIKATIAEQRRLRGKVSKKSRGSCVLVLGILAGLCYYSTTVLLSTGVGEDRSINLGLDLAGGVSITYPGSRRQTDR